MRGEGPARAVVLTPAAWGALLVLDLEVQIAAGRERQRGWLEVCAGTGRPGADLPRGGELVYGPRGAHVEVEL